MGCIPKGLDCGAARSFGSTWRRVGTRTLKLYDGSVLTRVLRATYRGHKIELIANEEMILADVERGLGGSSFSNSTSASGSIAMASRRGRYSAWCRALDVYAWGILSASQAKLLESGVLSRLLELIEPRSVKRSTCLSGLSAYICEIRHLSGLWRLSTR